MQIEKDDDRPEDIKRVIEWVTTDDFWMNQCLSVRKFRQKKDGMRYFDKFTMLMSTSLNDIEPKRPSEKFVN